MNIIKKLWNKLFGPKDENFDKEMKKVKMEQYDEIFGTLLSFSDASYMCSLAARICVGTDVEQDYEKRLQHISRVVGRGHESTIAHSNIIILLSTDQNTLPRFFEIANALKFTDFATSVDEEGTHYILIGGSIRAFKYFFREAKDLNNPFCNTIKEIIYQSCEYVFFEDFIADGLMDKDKFRFYPKAKVTNIFQDMVDEKTGESYKEEFAEGTFAEPNILKGEYADILYADPVLDIFDRVSQYGFTLRDVLRLTTFTVLFHDVSRIISQQMTRHFAAISQESQRYVNYSDAPFIDPTQYNTEKYTGNEKYRVNIGKFLFEEGTATDIGNLILSIYPQLIEQGMLKQDARAYLPSNVRTKLLMTFTFANGLHFIKERRPEATAAQPEIRTITGDMIEGLYNYEDTTFLFASMGLDYLINLTETPIYKTKELEGFVKDESIDEIIDEVVEEEVR